MSELQPLSTADVSAIAAAVHRAADDLMYVTAGVLAVAAICVWAAAVFLRRHPSSGGDGPGDLRWRTRVEKIVTGWLAVRLGAIALALASLAVCLPALNSPDASLRDPIICCSYRAPGTFS